MARSGMISLLDNLRSLTDAGINDWVLGTSIYWSDDTLQKVMDRHRIDLQHHMLNPKPTYIGGGSIAYYNYNLGYGNLESGTAVFTLEDSVGLDLSGTNVTMDYDRGQVAFAADTLGSTLYITAHSFDLNGAAADVWRIKMSNSAKMYDFSTDGHNLSRSQYMAHCKEMAEYYERFADPVIMQIYREDMIGAEGDDDVAE